MKNKKGAIELSMTTIIVIVLGVTLLVLGLAFVKDIFGNLGEISGKTFNQASDMLKGLEDVDKLLTINPGDIQIKQGEDKPVKIILANLGEDTLSLKAKVTNGGDSKLTCMFFDSVTSIDSKKGKSESDTYTINSGKQQIIALIAKDENGELRRTGCVVEVVGAPAGEQKKATLLIKVVKE